MTVWCSLPYIYGRVINTGNDFILGKFVEFFAVRF
jgi:hypothetical protein